MKKLLFLPLFFILLLILDFSTAPKIPTLAVIRIVTPVPFTQKNLSYALIDTPEYSYIRIIRSNDYRIYWRIFITIKRKGIFFNYYLD